MKHAMIAAHQFLVRFRYFAALITGGLSALGFQPWGLWPVTLACFALLIWMTAQTANKRQAFLTGWAFGVGHFCWGLQWIAVAFTYQAAMPAWLGYGAVFLLSLYLAVYPGLASLGAWWVGKAAFRKERHSREGGSPAGGGQNKLDSRLRGNDAGVFISLPFILAYAGLWIITEWLRSWVFTGFAWNPLSAVSVGLGALPQISSQFGTYGLSGVVVIIAGAFLFLAGCRWLLAVAVLLLSAIAALLPNSIDLTRPAIDTRPHITIVQPNISQEERYDPALQARNIQRLAALTPRTSNQQEPRMVFWSESALPWYLEEGYPARHYFDQPGNDAAATRRAIAQGLLGEGDILIAGNDRLRFDKAGKLTGAHNSVAAIDSGGKLLGWYDKAHLVPYGEYLPLAFILEPLGLARLVPGDVYFWPGPGPRTLNLGKGYPRAGMQICYEIIFSGQVVDRANRPDFIFNPSNDAWFGDVGPPQHLAQARLRAIEEGLPVVRSTPTGISAVIGPDGRVLESLPLGTAGRIDARLPIAAQATLFARFGNILPVSFALLLLAIALIPVARSQLSR